MSLLEAYLMKDEHQQEIYDAVVEHIGAVCPDLVKFIQGRQRRPQVARKTLVLMALANEAEIQDFFRAHENNIGKFEHFHAEIVVLVDKMTKNKLSTTSFVQECTKAWILA